VRLWGGRFAGASDPRATEIGRSVDVDRELALDDLAGSEAHVRGLFGAGILTADERDSLLAGLASLRDDAAAGRIAWDADLEDVHLNLEVALRERAGRIADKLHTGRSRNDQVATDLRLYARRSAADLDARVAGLERALVGLAARHQAAVMPGATHLQPAQPVLLAHHLLAYVEMLERDRGRLRDAVARARRSPLGSGAIAGAGFAIDREAVARDLGFDAPTTNSIDATSDRDFVVELLAAAALCVAHLSRLAEEVTWWSNPAFAFVRLAEPFTTGSSMMPNKRNPDPAELVRGKAARIAGDLATVLGVLKGLPLAYQRDLQETVEPLIDGVRTLALSLDAMTGLVEGLEVSEESMRAAAGAAFSTATAVSDVLVERGVAFREAHRVVGSLVRALEGRGASTLADAHDAEWTAALAASSDATARGLADDPSIGDLLRAGATVEAALARADVLGGTAPERVSAALADARTRLEA
jgi:argininosuccinate lyase